MPRSDAEESPRLEGDRAVRPEPSASDGRSRNRRHRRQSSIVTETAHLCRSGPSPRKNRLGDVVLDYCAAVRGILNNDQGGPLDPPGLRMADALDEVRQSIQRNLDAKKGGSRRSN